MNRLFEKIRMEGGIPPAEKPPKWLRVYNFIVGVAFWFFMFFVILPIMREAGATRDRFDATTFLMFAIPLCIAWIPNGRWVRGGRGRRFQHAAAWTVFGFVGLAVLYGVYRLLLLLFVGVV